MGGRHHYLARELSALGHNVTLIAARRHHLLRDDVDANSLPPEEIVNGYRFKRIDVPLYAHAHDKRRVLAWAIFTARLWNLRVPTEKKPDVILYSSPQLIGFLAAERLARRYRARLVLEVRDIWPLTLLEIGGFSPFNPVIMLLRWIETRAYRRAERVISNLPGAVDHMVLRGMDRSKFAWVPNGIDLQEVSNPDPLSTEIASLIPSEGLRVAYTGTLGVANSLESLLSAAHLSKGLPISFLIAGNGRECESLQTTKDQLQLSNVQFLGQIPKSQIQSLLKSVDITFLGWQDLALYKWGIAANKLPEYLYAAKPIVHAYSGSFDPVATFNAGFTVAAGKPDEIYSALKKALSLSPYERDVIGNRGRNAAIENYDYKKIAKNLENVLCPYPTNCSH